MWFWKKRQDYRKINIDETVTDIEMYISKIEKEEREKLLYEQGKKEVDFSENSKKIKPKPHKAPDKTDNTKKSSNQEIRFSHRDGCPEELLIEIEKQAIQNKTFVEAVQCHIRTKQLKDSKVYKAVNMDRRLFSKIMSDKYYKPSKDTAILLALALKLGKYETIALLDCAGYTLSHSVRRDIIIEYCIKEHIYSINDVNELLFNLSEKTLGR